MLFIPVLNACVAPFSSSPGRALLMLSLVVF
jgi:hypothetical protein